MHGKRNCARIEFQGTAKSVPGTNANPTGMSMTILDGSFSGVSWFDPELGITIDMTMNQDMKMAMTIPLNGRGNAAAAKTQMMTMTNIMSQVITLKLDSVK
jgi:CubicO group peptidase (beta-lactamase class C family)